MQIHRHHRDARNIVGPAVARFRNAWGWSQANLAAKCQMDGWDISRSIVAAIEGRVRRVGDWEITLLARALKVTLADLLVHGADPLSMIKVAGPKQHSGKILPKPRRRKRAKPRRRS